MNREGRAAMTMKTYCGNLLWQSSLTLLAPGTCAGNYGTIFASSEAVATKQTKGEGESRTCGIMYLIRFALFNE